MVGNLVICDLLSIIRGLLNGARSEEPDKRGQFRFEIDNPPVCQHGLSAEGFCVLSVEKTYFEGI